MSSTRRCWLVDRSIDDGRIITTTYATPDGRSTVTRQRTLTASAAGVPVSIEVTAGSLAPVDDPDQRAVYRSEVDRMRAEHAPDARV